MTQFQFIPQRLPGVVLIEPFRHADARGEFVKTFHAANFASQQIEFTLREEFFSISQRGVLRGMHFQTPPYAHSKMVTCLTGAIVDVLVDLRHNSPTYGEHAAYELSGDNRRVLYVPVGLAHGFVSTFDGSCVAYKTDREHAPENDCGIRWDSFGYTWPIAGDELIISPRDQHHPALAEFTSPF
ncbi:MAG: dTDP-4-dehydrorhamnose 3,5-epimerase [Pirellulales bacterium]